jgi:hypothetical protein
VVEVGFEGRVQLAGEVAFEAAHDLPSWSCPGRCVAGVVAGGGVDPQAGRGDGGPQGAVGLAVAALRRISPLMSRSFVHKIIIAGCRCFASPLPSGPHQEDTMPKDSDTQVPAGGPRTTTYRGRLFVVLLALIGAAIFLAGIVVSRKSNDPISQPSTDQLAENGTTTTSITIPTRAEVTSRLRSILGVRDKALLARDAKLLSEIYTIDCECLEDGQALIRQLQEENIVWKGVRTQVSIKSAEEVNDRLWIVVATVRTPSVRIETEGGRLVRIVPPEQNSVRFALAKPQGEEEWLLGHASTFE